jgi:hypothetical protein
MKPRTYEELLAKVEEFAPTLSVGCFILDQRALALEEELANDSLSQELKKVIAFELNAILLQMKQMGCSSGPRPE